MRELKVVVAQQHVGITVAVEVSCSNRGPLRNSEYGVVTCIFAMTLNEGKRSCSIALVIIESNTGIVVHHQVQISVPVEIGERGWIFRVSYFGNNLMLCKSAIALAE